MADSKSHGPRNGGLVGEAGPEHEAGNLNCAECRRGYPLDCECGGLIHKGESGRYATGCDRCDEPAAKLKADELTAGADDEIKELFILTFRGGGCELVGVYPAHGDHGPMLTMLAGDEEKLEELKRIARSQLRYGFEFKVCRFVRAEVLETIGEDVSEGVGKEIGRG